MQIVSYRDNLHEMPKPDFFFFFFFFSFFFEKLEKYFMMQSADFLYQTQ